MRSKKVLTVSLVAIMVVALSVCALARFSYVSRAYSRLSISGSRATVTGYVRMTDYGEAIDITTRLMLDGEEIESWSTPTSQTSDSKTIQKTVSLKQRGTYLVETEYTVYGTDGGEEYDITYSDEIEY